MCRDADLKKMGAHCVTGGVTQARASRTPGMCPWSHQGSDAEGEGKVCCHRKAGWSGSGS